MTTKAKRPHSAGASLANPFKELEERSSTESEILAPLPSNGALNPIRVRRSSSAGEGFVAFFTPPKILQSKSWIDPSVLTSSLPSKEPMRTYDPNLFDIMDITPKVLAKQMSIVDMAYFKKITREEFLSLEWTGKNPEHDSPGIFENIRRFNNLTLWFANQILSSNNVKRRAEKVDHFIEIAKICSEYHNYNGVKCILASLQSAPIYRLSKTWELVEKKKVYEYLNSLMSSDNNYEKYRKKINSIKGEPCIPYLGQCLTDLVFHSEMKSKSQDGQKNLEHYLDNLLKMQQDEYDFQKIPETIEFLSSSFFISEFERQYEEENYNQSLKLEPKNTSISSSTSSLSLSNLTKSTSSSNITSLFSSSPNSSIMMSFRQTSSTKLAITKEVTENNNNKCLICDDTESDGESEDYPVVQIKKAVIEDKDSHKEELNVKLLMDEFKKSKNRQWKKYTCAFNTSQIILYKSPFSESSAPLSILEVNEETFVGVANDYKKRKHVIRISPKGYEYFFECQSEEHMNNLLERVTLLIKESSERNLINL